MISLLGTTKFQLKADKDSNFIEKEDITIGLGNKYLDEIYDAILRKNKIKFIYKGFLNTEAKEVIIAPILLKLHNQRWYIVGKDNNKTYSLDRMLELTTLDNEKFDFVGNKKGLFNNVIGISQPELTPEKVVLLFNKRQGAYVKSLPIHSSQNIISDDDNGLKIEINVGVNWELKEEIKKHGSLVEVLKPLHLADKIKHDLIRTLKKYENK
jgi:predicted DNA-binding transcriptional regulator YafY